ncbi:MAG: hypothetical protein HY518_05905, partial [Candidatus Aenigmarchaeota archaeon]|nr:hypothetical protein [Candidatus Aenigmarchaeota archaeon]
MVSAQAGSWWGNVTIVSGTTINTSTNGAPVEALINNISKQNTTVGFYSSGYYLIDVEGTTPANVTFRIFGIDADPTNRTPQTYSIGDHGQLNLLIHKVASANTCPRDYNSQPNTGNIHNGCSDGFCVHNTCRSAATNCGDGFCDSGETCTSCSGDCGACASSGGGS